MSSSPERSSAQRSQVPFGHHSGAYRYCAVSDAVCLSFPWEIFSSPLHTSFLYPSGSALLFMVKDTMSLLFWLLITRTLSVPSFKERFNGNSALFPSLEWLGADVLCDLAADRRRRTWATVISVFSPRTCILPCEVSFPFLCWARLPLRSLTDRVVAGEDVFLLREPT